MKSIAESSDLSHVTGNLRAIARHVLTRQRMRCSLNATPEAMTQALSETERFIGQLPQSSASPTALTHDDFCVQVNMCS